MRRLSNEIREAPESFKKKLVDLREKTKTILWKALTEPTPTIAGIQQVRRVTSTIAVHDFILRKVNIE